MKKLSLLLILSGCISPAAAMNVNSLVTHFHKAITKGNTKATRQLLDNYGVSIEAPVFIDQTPIHTAAIIGNLEAFNLLLERGANIEHRVRNGSTVLHSAAVGGNLSLAKLALETLKKKQPTIVNAVTDQGVTPLYCAAYHGRPEIIRLLKEHGAHVEARDHNGATPLHAAALANHARAIEELLILGAKIDALDISHSTPLHQAYGVVARDAINMLEKYKANNTIRNSLNLTPSECYGYAIDHLPLKQQ